MQRICGFLTDRTFLFLAVLLVLAIASSPGLASDGCASAEVDEPFVLPDGSIHQAGKVTLCHSHEHSPVKTMHRVLVDRQPIGMFSSERQIVTNDDQPSPYYLIFDRRAGSTLRLAGYGRPSGAHSEMHLLDRPARVDVRDSVGDVAR